MRAEETIQQMLNSKNNFIFLGEAGCGKSETALNFALKVKEMTDKEVHFFDLDQTKPLFRSRDVRKALEAEEIFFHYEEQFQDAPTSTGGVNETLSDPNAVAILDVGGNDTGSRLVGEYSGWMSQPGTQVFFMLNVYRPWSGEIGEIDQTMTMIYRAARIGLENTSVIFNPNLGRTTTAEEILEGAEKSEKMIGSILPVSFLAVREDCAEQVIKQSDLPVFPMSLMMTYDWDQKPADH
ncbi:MAG: hypothetical protein LKH51_01835 [Eubacterium sp.]|nr:hypothetical protein [Eubacterium sp.]